MLVIIHIGFVICFMGLSCLESKPMQVPNEFTCALKCNAQVQPTFINTHKEGIYHNCWQLGKQAKFDQVARGYSSHKTTMKVQTFEFQQEGKLMFINAIFINWHK